MANAKIDQFNALAAQYQSDRAAIAAIINPVFKRKDWPTSWAAFWEGYEVDPTKPPWNRIIPTVENAFTPQMLQKIQPLQSSMGQLAAQMYALYKSLNPTNYLPLEVMLAAATAGTAAALVEGGAAAAGSAAAAAATPAAAAAPAAAVTIAPVATGAVASAATAAGASAASELAAATAGATAATATAATTAASVGDALAKLTGSSTVGKVVSSVIGEGSSLIADVSKYLDPLLSFAKSVLSDIDAIDTKYIEPFTTTFLKEYDTVTGAIQTVESLAHQGLQGILAIPQVISGTVSGLENGVIAAAQQTNANQSDLVKGTLAPAISVGIGEPVAKLTGLFGTFAAPGYSTIGLEPPINTEAPAIKDNIRTVLSAHAEALRGQGGFVNDALAGVYDILQFFIAFAGSFEGLLEAARYEGNNDTRPVPLDMGAALEAWRRGILTTANMQTEMAFHGLSDPRISVMSELAKWLPSEVSALRMFLRNIISKDDYNKIQAGHGMTEQDAKAFMDSELEPIDPREAIELNGRMAMRDAKWLAESLGTDIPKEYTALYPPFAKDPNRGVLDWAAHWKIPNIEWWFVAYFRKLVSKQDVTNAAKAENWPTEVIDNMFEVRQELIQEWMIPDILASGVMTDQEALDYMSFAGIEPKSAQILLEWGHTKSRAGGNKQANDLAGLSIGQAQRMYMDGIINQQEFELVLLDHGYSDVAASLTISLANNELDLSSRKAFATLAMKNVLVGNQTLTDMQSMLLGQGYTLKEVQNYVNTVQAQQADKTHAPSTAEAGDMLKKDIITYGEAVSAMRLNGWNDFWLVKWLIYYGGNDIDLATATGPASTLTSTGYFNALAAQTKPASA